MDPTYGRTPDNPIQLNSVVASRLFLDNLVSAKGYHIIYHRLGSFQVLGDGPIIDHYEVMSSDNHYDDFYINIYNDTNEWIPPDGYLFEYNLDGISFFLSDFERNELNEPEIIIAERYLFNPVLSDDPDEEMTPSLNIPLLELYMDESSGVNGFNDEFPYYRIKELIMNHSMYTPDRLEDVLSSIKTRGKTNFEVE